MAQAPVMSVSPSLSVIYNGGGSPTNPLTNTLNFSNSNSVKIRGMSIKCARVGGVQIPENKRIEYSLQYIHGIGRTRARQILVDLNMENKITKDLSEEELIIIRNEVSKFMIEGELRRFNALNIERLKAIQCYRGIRHIKMMPCRGQRTRNNCQTWKRKDESKESFKKNKKMKNKKKPNNNSTRKASFD